MVRYLMLLTTVLLCGCQQASEDTVSSEPAPAAAEAPASNSLAAFLDAQPDDVKVRYQYRHPQQTLQFFGIEPGMTVVEGLPGRGWYTKLLLNYLGSDGCLIGANYSMEMWPLFSFASEEFLAGQATWGEAFKSDAEGWGGDNAATLEAFYFGSMPESFAGTVDVVFFPRVLHNLANFQNAGEGEFLAKALADVYAVLKPGGLFGVVQHRARDNMSDEFANGTHGYLKRDWIVEQIERAGFEFVAESDINENERDRPTEDEVVWRLPPSYNGAGDDAELMAALDAIGESHRMTLKFRKPE
ncbi:MAG: methyltransferase [Gammaproteobacteria bacterium]|nr:methyltransferase [Gammaproteobacteria bacterium]